MRSSPSAMPHGISKPLLADDALRSHDFDAAMRKVIELKGSVPLSLRVSLELLLFEVHSKLRKHLDERVRIHHFGWENALHTYLALSEQNRCDGCGHTNRPGSGAVLPFVVALLVVK